MWLFSDDCGILTNLLFNSPLCINRILSDALPYPHTTYSASSANPLTTHSSSIFQPTTNKAIRIVYFQYLNDEYLSVLNNSCDAQRICNETGAQTKQPTVWHVFPLRNRINSIKYKKNVFLCHHAAVPYVKILLRVTCAARRPQLKPAKLTHRVPKNPFTFSQRIFILCVIRKINLLPKLFLVSIYGIELQFNNIFHGHKSN